MLEVRIQAGVYLNCALESHTSLWNAGEHTFNVLGNGTRLLLNS